MARITVEDCIDKFESRFELVLVASNRARKLHSGEVPTVEKDNDKNTVIALREIADETVSISDMKTSLVQEYQTVSSQDEEDPSLEYSDSQDNQSDLETSNQNNEDNTQEDNLTKDKEVINVTLSEKSALQDEITDELLDNKVINEKDDDIAVNSEG